MLCRPSAPQTRKPGPGVRTSASRIRSCWARRGRNICVATLPAPPVLTSGLNPIAPAMSCCNSRRPTRTASRILRCPRLNSCNVWLAGFPSAAASDALPWSARAQSQAQGGTCSARRGRNVKHCSAIIPNLPLNATHTERFTATQPTTRHLRASAGYGCSTGHSILI